MHANPDKRVDVFDRATAYAAEMYPQAEIRIQSFRGRPIVLAVDENVIRIARRP
jgi:hypothetical protein